MARPPGRFGSMCQGLAFLLLTFLFLSRGLWGSLAIGCGVTVFAFGLGGCAWLAALRTDHSEVPAKGASFQCALLAQWNESGRKVLSEGVALAHSFAEDPAKGASF